MGSQAPAPRRPPALRAATKGGLSSHSAAAESPSVAARCRVQGPSSWSRSPTPSPLDQPKEPPRWWVAGSAVAALQLGSQRAFACPTS